MNRPVGIRADQESLSLRMPPGIREIEVMTVSLVAGQLPDVGAGQRVLEFANFGGPGVSCRHHVSLFSERFSESGSRE